MGILQLLFNLYILSLGYDSGTLGLLVAMPPIVITISAIPMACWGIELDFDLHF